MAPLSDASRKLSSLQTRSYRSRALTRRVDWSRGTWGMPGTSRW